MKKILISFFCFAFIFSVSKSNAQEKGQIVIGAQGPETGAIATSGLQILAGVKLAIKEINDNGGVNGKPIKLINIDSRGDKVESVNAAKKLIHNKVCVIAGDLSSGSMFAIRDVVDRSKTPIISSGATADGVTTGRPFVFRNILLDSHGVPAIIKTAVEKKGWKNFVIITSENNDSSVAMTALFKKELPKFGATIVAEQTIFDGDADVSAQITSLKNKKFDAVIYTGYYGEASLLLLELRKQNMPQTIIGGDGIMFPTLWEVAKDAAVGTMFFSGYAPDYPDPKVADFNKRIKTMKVEPDAFAAQGYDAVYLFVEAIKKAGVTDCGDVNDREKIRKALAEIKDFDGISGKMTFDIDGNAVKQAFVQEVIKTEKGFGTRLVK